MKTSIIASALAFTALTTAQGVQAQQACVESADLSDAVTYAVPILYDSLQSPCSAQFADSSYMTNEAPAAIEGFRARQDAAWPGTLRLMKVFMAERAGGGEGGEDQMAAMIASLPEESLRPIVDMVVSQMLGERLANEMKPSTCSDVAEAMEIMAPLPPENVGALAAFIARQAELDSPSICPVEPAN